MTLARARAEQVLAIRALQRIGFALRRDRVTSAEHPGLWFVGHNYDSSGGLSNIRRDAPLAAAAAAALRT